MGTLESVDIFGLRSDGGQVLLRSAVAADSAALGALCDRVSEHAIYLRFFSGNRESARRYYADVARTAVPGRVLLACSGDQIVGAATFAPVSATSAEMSLLVQDDYRGEGVGTLLLEHLMSRARGEGIETFIADVLEINHVMLAVLRDLGYCYQSTRADAALRVSWRLVPNAAAQQAADARDALADCRSLEPLLRPRSVAVIGASDRPRSVGGGLLHTLVDGGFNGTIYPVNPKHLMLLGLPTYPSAAELPEAPDLAVIAVPASEVLATVSACGERGVGGIVLVSAGFGETTDGGAQRQRDVLACAHRYGMRLIGPNCLGVMNTDPAIRLSATFAALAVDPGGFALGSQSGALGIAVVAAAARRGLGLSQFVSLGNKADVSGNDLLRWWAQDDATRVVGLYLESFGDPRTFARIARALSRDKPILVLKSGRTDAGRRAGMSHTASAAASDVVVDALCAQAGVVRVETIEELIDAAVVLDTQPVPRGPRVAILGNSGGPQILACDIAASVGLLVEPMSPATVTALLASAPSTSNAHNPIDLGAGADLAAVRSMIELVAGSGEVDSLLVILAPTAAISVSEILTLRSPDQAMPLLLVVLGGTVTGEERRDVFDYPEAATVALGYAWRYAQLRDEPDGADWEVEPNAAATARAALAGAPEDGWLSADAVAKTLSAYGIGMCPQRVVASPDQAELAAQELGYPVAMKVTGIVHKSDVAGVLLDRRNPAEVREAFSGLAAPSGRVLVQAMARPGVELIVGAVADDTFGPLVMLGLGGTSSDLMPGRTFRLAPVTDADAASMVAALPTRLMNGFRGMPAISRSALSRLVEQVSALVCAHPQIMELDLNPVVAAGAGILVLDARIRVGDAATYADPLAPRLG
jgi:acyl-CoA synthetase (NDP forming)/GNAT superfamily N-acetyltransferase